MEDFEKEHVTDVYDRIANSFNRTRKNPWPQVVDFINNFLPNSFIGDMGCGNGRFMLTRDDCKFEGCDNIKEMVRICKEQNLKVTHGNITNLPFPNHYFNGIINIAVLHHLTTPKKRYKAVKELIRVVKPGGKLLIEVWSYEASINSKFRFQTIDKLGFNEQDKFLSWKEPNQKEDQDGKFRYYHLFKENEILNLVRKFNVTVKDIFLDHGNWFVVLEKNFTVKFRYEFRAIFKPWYECGWSREIIVNFPKGEKVRARVKNDEIIKQLRDLIKESRFFENDGYRIRIRIYVENMIYVMRKTDHLEVLLSILKKELF